jgi:hypothetical protein
MPVVCLVLLCLLLGGCATVPDRPAAAPTNFRHLEVVGNGIATLHSIALVVSSDGSLRTTPATHRRATFDEHPFEVSLAALVASDAAVMVHAEHVADSSGASNYDSLPLAGWPDSRFRLRSQCVSIDRETAAAEHDLAYLGRNGFDPAGNLALDQYFATSADHNQEVVISIVARVADCSDEAANRSTVSRIRDRIRVAGR